MSGFLQRLLASASGEPAGTMVRVQPAPAWAGTGTGAAIDIRGGPDGGVDGSLPVALAAPARDGPHARQPGGPGPGHTGDKQGAVPDLLRYPSGGSHAFMPWQDAPTRAGDFSGDVEGASMPGPEDGLAGSRDDARASLSALRSGAVSVALSDPPGPDTSTARGERERDDRDDRDDRGRAGWPQPLLAPAAPAQRDHGAPLPPLPPSRSRREAQASETPAAASVEPVVHVTIGRIDLVAQAPAVRPRPAVRATSTVPLSDYLRGQPGGRR